MRARWALESTGLSLLVLLPFFDQLLFPRSTVLLHHRLALTNPICGILIDLVIISAIGFAALALVCRLSSTVRQFATGMLAGLVLWAFAFCFVSILVLLPFSSGGGSITSALSGPPAALERAHAIISRLNIALPMLFTAFAALKPRITNVMARVLRYGLAAFAFCGLWIVPQLLYLAFELHSTPSFDHSTAVTKSGPGRRIVWVLFDELSYDLAFDHLPPGQQFPRLQGLRSQSVSLANLQPLSFKTEQIIPSLLAGQEMEDLRGSSNGDLLHFDPAQHRWINYNSHNTLFGLATANGWNPGVAGWYNAYCRVFADVLTACSWRPGIQDQLPFERIGGSGRKSAFTNSLVIPKFLFELFFWQPDESPSNILNENLTDYRDLMAGGHKLIENGKIDFVFLHLPLPHPPGLYNRYTRQLCTCGNYLDNLALTDVALGELLDQIDHTPWKDRTTVIVSSDHSWRVPLWAGTEFWTPEEQRVSQNRFDERPVFMVHFPGQTLGTNIAQPVPELAEHDLIASMLQGKIQSAGDLTAALQSTTAPIPVTY